MTGARLAWAASLILLLAGSSRAQEGGATAIRFSSEASDRGITMQTVNGDPARNYIIETLGSGVGMLDYDLDGDLDLYFAQGSTLEPDSGRRGATGRLYRNDGSGRFEDVTRGSGLESSFWGFGTAVGDYDNDGDPDLLVTAWGPSRLFRNERDGRFVEVAKEAGLDAERFGTGAAFFDYDADGLLDLYVATYLLFDPARIPRKGDPDSPCNFRGLTVMCGPHGLPSAVHALYHNEGDGTFSDVTAHAGIVMQGDHYGLGVTSADIDADGKVDLLVANDSTPNLLYRNLGNGRFSEEGVMAGFAYSNDGREQAGMGIDAGDIDGDGDLDVFITNFSHDYSTLRLGDGRGALEDVSIRVGLAESTMMSLGWGTCLIDLDNDGDLDLFIANGHVYPEVDTADIGTTYRQQNQVFENLGSLRFRKLAWPSSAPGAPGAPGLHRSAAPGDLDGDGDLDLVVTVLDGRPELLVNQSNGGGWLMLRLVGRETNRDGVGARVVVSAGERRWMAERRGGGSYLAAPDPRLHFGLGRIAQVDQVEVRWPSGRVQRIDRPPVGTLITVVEPTAGGGDASSGKSASGKSPFP